MNDFLSLGDFYCATKLNKLQIQPRRQKLNNKTENHLKSVNRRFVVFVDEGLKIGKEIK